MGFISKIFKSATKIVKAVVDPIIDFGANVVKGVLSPFLGAFSLPDISVNADVGNAEIKAATVVDFNGSNRAVPVVYGNQVEIATIPVFVGVWGDNSADDTKQYLYMAAIISQGFHGSSGALFSDPYIGSCISRMLVDGKPVNLELDTTSNPNYGDGSTVITSDVGLFASGKGGVQPAVQNIITGTFANRLTVQYFDGSSDQPASSLLQQHPTWTADHKLSGMHYIALRFLLQAADVTVGSPSYPYNGEGVYVNPYNNVPAVVVTCSGRSTPNLVGGFADDPGWEERFQTAFADRPVLKRYHSYHRNIRPVSGTSVTVFDSSPASTKVIAAAEVHSEIVPSDTEMLFVEGQEGQAIVDNNFVTQPVNVHNILKNLQWTYPYVYFKPASFSGGVTTTSALTDEGIHATDYWFENVGGSHYRLVGKNPEGGNTGTPGLDDRILVTTGELTFMGFSDPDVVEQPSASGPPQSGGHGTYRWITNNNTYPSQINDYINNGFECKLRIRDIDADTNTVYDIVGVDYYSTNAVDLHILGSDSTVPSLFVVNSISDGVIATVEIYSNTSSNGNKNPANWDIALGNGYKSEGLIYESYICDNNPVEMLLDYLINPNYGSGLSLEEIDKVSWTKAAVCCDRIPNYFGFDATVQSLGDPYPLSTSIDNVYMYGENANGIPQGGSGILSSFPGGRIQIAGNGLDRHFIVDTNKTHLENINIMLSSIGAYMPYINGKYFLFLENAGDPVDGSHVLPSSALPIQAVITEDNIIEGVSLQTPTLNDRFNSIKLDYTDIAQNSQPDSLVQPDPTDDSANVRQQYLNEDNGKPLEGNFSVPSIFNDLDADRYSRILLKKSRGQPVLNFTINAIGLNLIPGDFIQVKISLMGLDDVYRITDLTINYDNTVAITCIRHVPEVYDMSDAGRLFVGRIDMLS
jgi:hypothetical protein